ncbi:hypothetical protein ACL02U_13910 [Streptomyces sp. MS06]|uniref:hypothetical protein n=1 Tax=Streptomyces sp. MS06 TaxID=3385974 RepID=UPI0039A2F3B7
MLGAEAIAQALVTGTFLGVGPGTSAKVAETLLGDHVRQLHGSKPHRYLRLDFGLVEVTFGGEPDWECRWLAVHTHRLAEMPGLAGECAARFGLEFPGPVTWGQLTPAVGDSAVAVDQSPYGARYRIPAVSATVHLSADAGGGELGRVVEKIMIGA